MVLEVFTGDWVLELGLDDVCRPRLKQFMISIVVSGTGMIRILIISLGKWVNVLREWILKVQEVKVKNKSLSLTKIKSLSLFLESET